MKKNKRIALAIVMSSILISFKLLGDSVFGLIHFDDHRRMLEFADAFKVIGYVSLDEWKKGYMLKHVSMLLVGLLVFVIGGFVSYRFYREPK